MYINDPLVIHIKTYINSSNQLPDIEDLTINKKFVYDMRKTKLKSFHLEYQG